MLETAICDCAVELGLEKHILEAGGGLSKSACCNALPKGVEFRKGLSKREFLL